MYVFLALKRAKYFSPKSSQKPFSIRLFPKLFWGFREASIGFGLEAIMRSFLIQKFLLTIYSVGGLSQWMTKPS